MAGLPTRPIARASIEAPVSSNQAAKVASSIARCRSCACRSWSCFADSVKWEIAKLSTSTRSSHSRAPRSVVSRLI